MNKPRLTDNKRNKSSDEAIAYAMEQIEVIKQGKTPLSPSTKEKKLAMESHYERLKKLNDSIIESPINWQSKTPFSEADERGYGQVDTWGINNESGL